MSRFLRSFKLCVAMSVGIKPTFSFGGIEFIATVKATKQRFNYKNTQYMVVLFGLNSTAQVFTKCLETWQPTLIILLLEKWYYEISCAFSVRDFHIKIAHFTGTSWGSHGGLLLQGGALPCCLCLGSCVLAVPCPLPAQW